MSPVLRAPLLAVAISQLAQAWPAAPGNDAPQTPISAQDHSQGYQFDSLLHLR